MTEQGKMVCPECEGKKVISGTCVCDSEWRGTMVGNEWEDCQCTPEITCPKCQGTGYVTPEETCHD
ncbi:MAG: ankyrin [Desulfurivibrionaceae bacterium]